MNQYVPETFDLSGENVKVELDLSNYATKADLKGATCIDTSTLASETDLVSLKTKLHNLDVDKVEAFPADLSRLSNVG